MNHEIEAYEGELKELREHKAQYPITFNYGKLEALYAAQLQKKAFTWHKLECPMCDNKNNADLLQRNDGQVMCRQCYNDHFEET